MTVVAPNPVASRRLFVDVLGLPPRRHEGDESYFSEEIAGSKDFGIWPLEQAAQACFRTTEWPADRPRPQACVEFGVAGEAAVEAVGRELESTATRCCTRCAPNVGPDHRQGDHRGQRHRRRRLLTLDALTS